MKQVILLVTKGLVGMQFCPLVRPIGTRRESVPVFFIGTLSSTWRSCYTFCTRYRFPLPFYIQYLAFIYISRSRFHCFFHTFTWRSLYLRHVHMLSVSTTFITLNIWRSYTFLVFVFNFSHVGFDVHVAPSPFRQYRFSVLCSRSGGGSWCCLVHVQTLSLLTFYD